MSKNSIFLIFCFEIWFIPDGFLYQDISAAGREPQDIHPVYNSSFNYYSPCIQQFIYLLFTLYTTFHLIYYSPSLQHLIYSLFTLFTTFYLFIIHPVYNILFINYSPCIQHFIYLLFTLYTTFHIFIIHPVYNINFCEKNPIKHFLTRKISYCYLCMEGQFQTLVPSFQTL